MHVKRFKCEFVSSIQQIPIKYHENVQRLTLCKISTFYFLFIHCP